MAEQTAEETPPDDFSWANPQDVAVAYQQPIAIYRCGTGDIIIRQQDEMGDDEQESLIWIQPQNLDKVIKKLQEIQESIDE